MPLTIRRTGAADYGRFIKMLICAPAGAGKTVFGATTVDPLVADCEGGLMSIADRHVPYAEIESTLELSQLLGALDQEPDVQETMVGFAPGTLVIDTIDEVQKMFERERLKETGRDSLNMQDFGWLKDRMLDVIRGFRSLPMNVVFLCHVKETTDEETGTVSVKPGLKGAVADEIAAYMDIVGVITVEEFMDVQDGEAVKSTRRILQVQPDRRHDWLKDRSWKLPARVQLNGKTDFKRIYATVFKDDDTPAPDTTSVEVPNPPEEEVEKIERQPEQPDNPFPKSNDNDNELETSE